MNIEIKYIPAVLPIGNNIEIQTITVYIQNNIIAGINVKPDDFTDDKVFVNNEKKLLIPGLVNTHTHSYMSLFRNHADDLPFDEWFFKRILPLEDRLTGDDAYWGTMLSCIEMIGTGTTCFADMHMFPRRTIQAVHETGIRAVLARGLVGAYKDGKPDDGGRLREALEDIDFYKKQCNGGLITFFLAPHAIYTCEPEYLRYIAQAAQENDLGIHIHLSETQKEFDDCVRKHKMTPVELLESAGVFNVHTLAAHCVYVTENDINILCKHNVNVATNPVSNMKLGNGFAPITKLLSAGVNVSLGTDSAASNNSLNLFKELNALTLIHKGAEKNPTAINVKNGFKIATANGAKALSLDSLTGSIKIGMKADLAILNLDAPNFYPHNDIIAGLSYSATGTETETVIINGEVVMENREFKTIDTERVYYEVEQISNRLVN